MKIKLLAMVVASLSMVSSALAQNKWTNDPEKFMGKSFTIQSVWGGRFVVGSGVGAYDLKANYTDIMRDNCEVLHGGTGKDDLEQWYICPLGEISNGVVILNKKTGLALGVSGAFRKGLNKTPVYDPKLRGEERNADLLTCTAQWGPSIQKGSTSVHPQEAFAQVWVIEDAGNDNVRFRLKDAGGKLYLNVSDIRTDHGFDPNAGHKGNGAVINVQPDRPEGDPHADPKFQTFKLTDTSISLPPHPKISTEKPTMPVLVSRDLQDPKNVKRSPEIVKGYTLIPAIWGRENTPSVIRKTPFLLMERRVAYVRDDEVSRTNGISVDTPASEKTITTGSTQTTRKEFTGKVGLSVAAEVGAEVFGVGAKLTATASAELGYSSAEEFSSSWQESFKASYGPFPANTTVAYFHLKEIFYLKKPEAGVWKDMPDSRWEVAVKGNDVSTQFPEKKVAN